MNIIEPENKPRRTAEEEALLSRAKEKLMAEKGLSEAQAHRFLQKQSMDHGTRLADTARRLLEQAQPGKDA